MKSKKVEELLNLIKVRIKGERNFSENEVKVFIKLAELELSNDKSLNNFYDEIIKKFENKDEYWDNLLNKY